MDHGITWYEVLGVLPGVTADKIRREHDAKAALLRPDLIARAPSNVLKAVTRAQGMLDEACRVLGDPAGRERYDAAIGLRRSGGGLGEPGRVPAESGLDPADLRVITEAPGGDVVGGLLALTNWLEPKRRRQKPTAVPDVRGLFYPVCLDVTRRYGRHVTVVRLTKHPMAVEGLVVDQAPLPAANARRGDALTVQVWHPPARPA